jgi:ABC-2 type transport system ATP-binding protein
VQRAVSASSDYLVQTEDLTKHYAGGVVAVQGVRLTVRRGEVYGFLGPNGAGKSTTLRMLTGLVRPTSGYATVAGGRPGSVQSLARVGAMIEVPAFWPYLSGRDNLRLLARYCKLPDARVDAVLAEVDMSQRANRAVGAYSTGMNQRLGVAAALLKDPALLILDEPTSGLDPQGMAEFRELVKRIGQGERTVLLSTHLLSEAEQICTRVGLISKGRMVAEGTIDEIRGRGELIVRADPAARAYALLSEVVGANRVSVRPDGSFSVRIRPDEAGIVNERLVSEGITVSEFRPAKRSLEEAFLEMTGTESGS